MAGKVEAVEEKRDLAIVMGGGGARGAYQAGVLRAVADRYPDLRVSILTGVSAGAINAVYLASQPGNLRQRVYELCDMWASLRVDDIFRADPFSLAGHGIRWGMQLALLGGRRGVPNVRGLVDTTPLAGFLQKHFHSPDGRLDGIRSNLQRDLTAVATTVTDYSTGETVTFCEGDSISTWDRPMRRSVETRLCLEHVMASAALPLFFPAVELDGSWYGDGGVRLHSPLAPACHLGAERILAISTRYSSREARALPNVAAGYPPPAQILSVLYNAVFQDNLEQDASHMQRLNRLIAAAGDRSTQHRPIALAVVRPSVDLGREANDFEARLPWAFRFITRRLGTREQKSQDLMSMVMFQADYLCRLMEIGERDGRDNQDEIAALIEGR